MARLDLTPHLCNGLEQTNGASAITALASKVGVYGSAATRPHPSEADVDWLGWLEWLSAVISDKGPPHLSTHTHTHPHTTGCASSICGNTRSRGRRLPSVSPNPPAEDPDHQAASSFLSEMAVFNRLLMISGSRDLPSQDVSPRGSLC